VRSKGDCSPSLTRILLAAELERGRGAKLPEPSNLLALTAEAIPLLPVTGGTNGQITGGFILGDAKRRYKI
jgi:hypothetical protein